jgi:site-specific DNA-methyltransferase (adenine-specific)
MKTNYVLEGDCLIKLKELSNNSIDSIVTDPPYELGFMGKSWDNTGIAFNVAVWKECLRVLKPGGHMIAFSGSRTYHRMAVAIEDAGFEIRDQIMWVYGSGFPKSLNVGKALPDWQGWGTALKPAHEPMVLARKPLDKKTVAENVMAYGTGGLNIDGSRVGTNDNLNGGAYAKDGTERDDGWGMQRGGAGDFEQPQGRFPANFIHDGSDEVVALFPNSNGAGGSTPNVKVTGFGDGIGNGTTIYTPNDRKEFNSGSGSAARFFYCAKASKKDRNEGLEGFALVRKVFMATKNGTGEPSKGLERFTTEPSANHHPTVKPTSLMQYLVRLVTPPNGIVLDPFLGSGSTAKAATLLGFKWIGCEITPEYIPIIKARVAWAKKYRSKNG